MTVKVGLCGWSISVMRYIDLYPVVEVQQTFYEPPPDKVLLNWRSLVPDSFEFTVKAWQLITHHGKSPTYRRMVKRPLTDDERDLAGEFQDSPLVDEGWRATVHAANLLRAHTILFQCPPKFTPTPEHLANMRAFFHRIDRTGFRCVFEPRGKAWTADIVRELCDELDLVHVVDPFVTRSATTPASTPAPSLAKDRVHAGLTYYRLHGISGNRHVYTEEELRQLAEMVPESGETYVMFNNIPRAGDAPRFMRIAGVTPASGRWPKNAAPKEGTGAARRSRRKASEVSAKVAAATAKTPRRATLTKLKASPRGSIKSRGSGTQVAQVEYVPSRAASGGRRGASRARPGPAHAPRASARRASPRRAPRNSS